jgi:hypothetical protein
MGFIFAAFLLKKAAFKSPQSWGLKSTALLGALKLSPSLVGQALSQFFGQAGDTLMTSPQQMRLKVTPPDLSIMNWNMARMSYMLDVLLERHPIT